MPARSHNNPYEPGEPEKLSKMYAHAGTVRSTTPPDDPARQAGDTVAQIIADRRDSTGATYFELANPLMVPDPKRPGHLKHLDQRALRAFLARRGYENLPPSQTPYQGISINPRGRTATHFACGHPRVPENTWRSSKGLDICKTCQARMNKDYQARTRKVSDSATTPTRTVKAAARPAPRKKATGKKAAPVKNTTGAINSGPANHKEASA